MESATSNIEQYYEEVKDKYDLDLEHFKIICNSPFVLLKRIMTLGIMKNMRFQYFGNFEVSASRVKYSKIQLIKNYENQLISKHRYEERIKVLNNYERREETI